MPYSLADLRHHIADHTDALIKFAIWKEQFAWNERLGKPMTVYEINCVNAARAGLIQESEMLRAELRRTPRFMLATDPDLLLWSKKP